VTRPPIEMRHNPASHVEPFREQRRERFLNTEELARLGDAIREAETTGILWAVDDSNPALPTAMSTLTSIHSAERRRILVTAWPVRWAT
jgi:hypothetical protein